MSTPITPAATPNFPTSLTVPSNGDPLLADVFQANVEQPVLDGIGAARLALLGGGVRRRVICTSNTSLVIQPMGAVVATVGGVTSVVAHSVATTLNPLTAVTLAANTRYWVYAQLSGTPATLAFIISTDAPTTPGLAYRTGDASALYVSTFHTDGSSNIVLYSQSDNQYDFAEPGSTGTAILTAGNATVSTVVSFDAKVPTGISKATIRASYSSTVVTVIQVLSNSGSSALLSNETTNTGTGTDAHFSTSTVGGLSVQYLVGDAAATLSLHLTGFTL